MFRKSVWKIHERIPVVIFDGASERYSRKMSGDFLRDALSNFGRHRKNEVIIGEVFDEISSLEKGNTYMIFISVPWKYF